MSYTALYRKWRPERFEDVKGQDPYIILLNELPGEIGRAVASYPYLHFLPALFF